MKNPTALGQYLRERREELGLSLRYVARKTGRTAAFLAEIEMGRIYPTESMLKMIARALGDSVEELKSRDRQ